MAKSKYLKLKGTAKWAKVFEDNRDTTGWNDTLVDVGGQYVIDVALDEDSLMDLSASGSQTVDYPKVDDDGETYFRFKRIHEKKNAAGEVLDWASGAPEVIKADGSEWDFEDDGPIHNGSEVEITVCVYDAGKVGTRLEKVKVIEPAPVPADFV